MTQYPAPFSLVVHREGKIWSHGVPFCPELTQKCHGDTASKGKVTENTEDTLWPEMWRSWIYSHSCSSEAPSSHGKAKSPNPKLPSNLMHSSLMYCVSCGTEARDNFFRTGWNLLGNPLRRLLYHHHHQNSRLQLPAPIHLPMPYPECSTYQLPHLPC